MNVQELLDAGYRPFHDNTKDGRYCSYQKRFTDKVGTLYSITVSHFGYPTHGSGVAFIDRFDGSVQMTIGKPGHSQSGSPGTEAYEVFDIGYHATDQAIGSMEAFFARVWQQMQADYYERT